jgi:hypothetical protein
LLPAGAVAGVGLAPTGKRRLVTAHVQEEHLSEAIFNPPLIRFSTVSCAAVRFHIVFHVAPWIVPLLLPPLVSNDSPASFIEKILGDQTVRGNLVGLV